MLRSLRSLHQLCSRAAFSLSSSASTSGCGAGLAAAAGSLQAAGGAGAAAAALGAAAFRPTTLATAHYLARAFSTSRLAPQAAGLEGDEVSAPSINPLQQAPMGPRAGAGMPSPPPSAAEEQLLSRAVARNLAISQQKLNMFAKLIRGLHIEDALIQCDIAIKKSAKMCRNVLLSARANATNNHGLDGTKLRVAEAWVGKGVYLKRTSIHGRGRSGKRMRYRSHLTVVLREEEGLRRLTRTRPMLAERPPTWERRAHQQKLHQEQHQQQQQPW